MFLINSRAAFVTAIYRRTHKSTSIDTPYTEGTGPICRVPLTSLAFHVLAFSARASVPILSTACYTLCTNFSRALGINSFHPTPSVASYHYDPQLLMLGHPFRYLLIPKQIRALNESNKSRNINLTSIRHVQLRHDLGTD